MPPRLIDLHCDWLLQYAEESTTFDPALYAGMSKSLGQAEGYLQAASASVLACYRDAEDWAQQPDPWDALSQLITRIEAEFPGRVLIGHEDHARWVEEPDTLCWAIIGVEGFDFLVKTSADLERIPALFHRGVRVFQPVYFASNAMAGSSSPGDDRGLLDLGRAFLQILAELGTSPTGPRPILDLAHLNPSACSDVLTWLENNAGRPESPIPIYSHGALAHAEFSSPRALSLDNLKRLRALGGTIGFSVSPPFYQTPDALKAGIEVAAEVPFLGASGFEGIAIGTDFLGVDSILPGLGSAAEVIAWFNTKFSADDAQTLLAGTAARMIAGTVGTSRRIRP